MRLPQSLHSGVKKFYLRAPVEHRKTMLEMRARIKKAFPNVEEVVSYGMPAFKIKGEIVAGILAAKNHVGYYPFSGSTLRGFNKELARYQTTKSAIHVPIGKPLPASLIKKLIRARLSQCKVTRGEIDLSAYQKRDKYWRDLGLAAPACRGLIDKNLLNLKHLSRISEIEFQGIHGIGPKASKLITAEMKRRKVSFRP